MNTKTIIPTVKALFALTALLVIIGCNKKEPEGTSPAAGGKQPSSGEALQIQGSDTMVNLVQAWAEKYQTIDPAAKIEVGGGGSGVGIAALINGTVDIASSSRDMKADEKAKAKNARGSDPQEWVVGYDCLAVYVHKDNPLTEISIEQLTAIFAESGKTVSWKELGITVPGCSSDEIIRVSRQSSSGTYEFFREHVLNKQDFKLGSRDMNGSKEVVELVGSTPCAIGYSGMGYANDRVKMLKVASKPGAPAVAPSIDAAQNKSYPIARPLFLYTGDAPAGNAKKFLTWILSDDGQKIVEETGYVPVPAGQRPKLN